MSFKKTIYGEFPGGPVVRTQHFHRQGGFGAWVQSQVEELRSHKPHSEAPPPKKQRKKEKTTYGMGNNICKPYI